MVEIYRFAAVRPAPLLAPRVAAVPYDVVTREEAAAAIQGNPFCFLRVSRPDAELAGVPPSTGRSMHAPVRTSTGSCATGSSPATGRQACTSTG